MTNFIKENRYLVLRNKDICKYLTTLELSTLNSLCKKVVFGRGRDGKSDLKCVVVEDNWPMYESVWNMIEGWNKENREFVPANQEITKQAWDNIKDDGPCLYPYGSVMRKRQ